MNGRMNGLKNDENAEQPQGLFRVPQMVCRAD